MIVLHQDELGDTGIKLWRVNEPVKGRAQQAHRDDHYIFIIQREGEFLVEVDFNELRLTGPSVCFIAPGQVHRYIDLQQADAWLVFIDTALIPGQSREVFEACLNTQQTATINAGEPVFQLVPVLGTVLNQKNPVMQKTQLNTLAAALSVMVAAALVQTRQAEQLINGPKYRLVVRFKQLLAERFREIREVQAYADLLHITPLYLNEVIKTVTGFTASYWINQQVLLEAKRMLYYTMLDVKQVAYELGYIDHVYFSRFFKKHTGTTALAFRAAKP